MKTRQPEIGSDCSPNLRRLLSKELERLRSILNLHIILAVDGIIVMKVFNWLSGLRPKMMEVHHYKVLDPATGKWVVAPLKCTAEEITRREGLIIAGTMEVFARSFLDKDGCYDSSRKGRP